VTSKATGRLISWRADKGFGWVGLDTGGPDAFVHVSEYPGVPAVGQRLRFTVTATDKGPRAADVELLIDVHGNKGAA